MLLNNSLILLLITVQTVCNFFKLRFWNKWYSFHISETFDAAACYIVYLLCILHEGLLKL